VTVAAHPGALAPNATAATLTTAPSAFRVSHHNRLASLRIATSAQRCLLRISKRTSTKLTDFSAGLALKCKLKTCGGFGGIKSLTRTSVKVSKTGTFKVSGDILAVNNKKLGTETVTGKFVSATTVTGKVTTHANLGQYTGVTKSYTATRTPSTT
jgi:hypothetical protein